MDSFAKGTLEAMVSAYGRLAILEALREMNDDVTSEEQLELANWGDPQQQVYALQEMLEGGPEGEENFELIGYVRDCVSDDEIRRSLESEEE